MLVYVPYILLVDTAPPELVLFGAEKQNRIQGKTQRYNSNFKTIRYMEHELKQKVINQQIAGVSMEDFISDLIERSEKGEIENEKLETYNKLLKQENNRHKNITDAYRVINKSLELELLRLNSQVNHGNPT